MQTSVATVCLSASLSDALRSALEAVPEDVEPFDGDVLTLDGGPEDIDALADDSRRIGCANAPMRLSAAKRSLRIAHTPKGGASRPIVS